MALSTCPTCTAAYAVGLPACPQCGTEATTEEMTMPKINRNGPSYAPATPPDPAEADDADEGAEPQTPGPVQADAAAAPVEPSASPPPEPSASPPPAPGK